MEQQARNQSGEYLEKNPQGLIPVLEDGETVLFETGAILWHLAEKTGRLGPNGPDVTDPKARAVAVAAAVEADSPSPNAPAAAAGCLCCWSA